MRDAILKMLHVSDIIGIRAMLVQAKNQKAKSFYMKSGFTPSEIEPFILMLPLSKARASLNYVLEKRT